MTKNSKKDSLRFAAHSIKRSSPLRVFFAISRCKRLIFGGGTLLQSSTSRRSLFYYSALLIIAGRLKKECFLWANGIELPYGSFCKKLLRAALKNCSHIGVRDTPSLAIAKELAPRATAVFEEDLAKSEFSRKSNRERADFLLREAFGDIPDRFVIAVPRIKARSADVALLVKALVKERNRKNNILVIPMCPREDMEICEEICEDLGAKMIEGACFDDIVELSKLCLCVYSMRYHGLVAAALAGTEHIGIGNSEKIETYCKENGIKIISSEADE